MYKLLIHIGDMLRKCCMQGLSPLLFSKKGKGNFPDAHFFLFARLLKISMNGRIVVAAYAKGAGGKPATVFNFRLCALLLQ